MERRRTVIPVLSNTSSPTSDRTTLSAIFSSSPVVSTFTSFPMVSFSNTACTAVPFFRITSLSIFFSNSMGITAPVSTLTIDSGRRAGGRWDIEERR